MTRRFALLLGALIFGAAPSFGATGTTWRVDPGHSNAGFTVRHLIVTNVKGAIPIQRATIQTAEGSTLPESIDAALDAAKLNTGNDDRDADLRGKDWFDVANFPAITFASTQISGTPDAFTVVGNLTLHGVTKSVTLAAKTLGTTTDGRGRRHVGYEVTTKIDRRDFGLTLMSQSGAALIAGTEVAITIEVEAVAAAG
jgi:polyisoprenoid-binding protein YceI